MMKSMCWSIAMLIAILPTLHAQSEVIDRVLAVVAGEIITQSDVDGAVALGLVATTGAQDRRGAALDRLIERQLMLREVRRYMPPEPAQAAVEQRLQTLRQQFSSPAALAEALAISGMDEARLREFVRDDLRIEAYLGERFGSPTQATEEDVAAYYKEHLTEFTRAGQVSPLAEVRDTIHEKLQAQRRNTMIGDWLAGLTRRTEIIDLYLPRR
jgi:parvulin-like peptidyl-prolyl isomerase